MKGRLLKKKWCRIIVFKNWSRKSYSLFRVLNKVVAIAVLNVAYFLSADAARPAIQTDSIKKIREIGIEEIEISAQRAPAVFSQAARVVSVIGQKEIVAAPVSSVAELLEYVLSADIRQRGGEGVQADLSLRGSSFDQVMVLLNGVDITDPQTGHHNLNLPVNLMQIERVEIIEGPASRVFGPNAFSGAINFITRPADKNNISLNAASGSYDFFDGSMSGSVRTGKVGQYFSAGKKSSSGYAGNTDFEDYNLFYKMEAGATKNLIFQAGYSSKSFGANSFYTPKYPEQYEITGTRFSSLKWEPASPFHFSSTVFWRHHADQFELFRREAPSWYISHNYHLTNVYGLNLNGWIKSGIGKTAFGANWRSENILSNVLGKPVAIPVAVKGGGAFYTKSDSREVFSVFAEQSFYSERFALSAGVLANYFSGHGNKARFFPGVDISYKISKNFKVYISANQSLRMPTFTDLYYNGPTNVGNPELKPETAGALEAGLKFIFSGLSGHAVVYCRKGKNIIDWVRLESEEKWHTENLTALSSSGFELSIGYQPGLKPGASGFLTKVSAGYMFNNLEKFNNEYISNYALDNLKHKFNFQITHRVAKNLSANWALLFQDRNGGFTRFVDGKPGGETPYKPFVLLDSKLCFHYNLMDFFVSATNILDTHYYDIGNIMQAGRWFKIGVAIDVSFD